MYYVQHGDTRYFSDPQGKLDVGFISPWTDAQPPGQGKEWTLPRYACEIANLPQTDQRAAEWTPGDYTDGVDNKASDGLVWDGMRLWIDQEEQTWERALPSREVRVAKIPHLPGQPMKEYFARLKAVEPRYFQDKDFEHILRDMPDGWERMVRHTRWAEGFGIHKEKAPAEWAGQEMECTPSAYCTPRSEAVTICVGVSNSNDVAAAPEGAEYDYLEFLYAKDQEGKVMQIRQYDSFGMWRNRFTTYSFSPPRGTSSVTPFASFKIRGVWQGQTIEWDPTKQNEKMMWFTKMEPWLRKKMAEPRKLRGKARAEVAALPAEEMPVAREATSWPPNSYEGNAFRAASYASRESTV
mmetsp:Transcript_51692/g.123047  ORF Transcript_51692/g.123047 Transcript_51692/m.123047 type:complete len:353 (+) Transcript_51692:67-1125(+)